LSVVVVGVGVGVGGGVMMVVVIGNSDAVEIRTKSTVMFHTT
jgi:hypothetical protein